MAEVLQAFVKSIEEKSLSVNGIVVLQQGEKIDEYRWKPDLRQNQYSVSKSFTSMGIGIGISEGLLSLDDRVIDFFSEDLPDNPAIELKELKLRHLLMMATGHGRPILMADQRGSMTEKNWAKFALSQPFVHKPGARFFYTNSAPYLAAVMLQKAAGCNLVDYLMERLFNPLEIKRPEWEACPMGYTFGASCLMINTLELSRFGQLLLNKGNHNGIQLIPENWIKDASSKQIDTYNPYDGGMGYGYQFWRGSHNTYRADGLYGQFCIISEEKNAVIAINSAEENSQSILDSVWSYIMPVL